MNFEMSFEWISLELLFKNQIYLLYLAGVMAVSGMIKSVDFFGGLYAFLACRIASRRLLVLLCSALCGVLPVPGRVSVSAGILDTMATAEPAGRAKFGLIDYLATHHYYLWSPLEKTVVIPMAALGLSYLELLSHTGPLLVVSLAFIVVFVFRVLKEEDVQTGPQAQANRSNDGSTRVGANDRTSAERSADSPGFVRIAGLALLRGGPLLGGIALMILGFAPALVFAGLTICYAFLTGAYREPNKILAMMNWRLLGMLALVILATNGVRLAHDRVLGELEALRLTPDTIEGLAWISLFAFGSSFLMGSSSKFAGFTVVLTGIYGLEYFTYFFALEYAAYLVSPFHKCVTIGKMYFGSPLRSYAGALSVWAGLLILTGALFFGVGS